MKKTGAKILRYFCEGLMFLARFILKISRLLKGPLLFLWSKLLRPLISLTYRIYLLIATVILAIFVRVKRLIETTFYNRLALPIVLMVVVFFVVASNLYATTGGSQEINQSSTSLFESALVSDEEFNDQNESFLDDGAYDDDSETVPVTLVDVLSPDDTLEPTKQAATPNKNIAVRDSTIDYVVKDGQTIGAIARSFGLRTETVLSANNLRASSIIRAGQVLKILPVDGLLYVVKSGDTISKIAKNYSTEADQIITHNGLSKTGSLKIGAQLIIPGGQAPYVVAPKPIKVATNLKNIFTPAPANVKVSGKGMVWPTAARRITQYFKPGGKHTGVDIAGPSGTAIYAADDGIVVLSGWNRGGYGNMVLVDHGGGIYTRYAHGSKLLVQQGDTVTRGQTVMLMGSTGRSTGPHLHFEVMTRTPHHRINPFDYVTK